MHDLLLHFLTLITPSAPPSPHSSDLFTSITSPVPSPSPSTSVPAPTTGGDDGGIDSSVKVAIVTAIGVVIAAAVTALASTFQREKSPRSTVTANDTFTRDYINGLVGDQKAYRRLQKTYNFLREGCLERGLDPDDLIDEQRQRDASSP